MKSALKLEDPTTDTSKAMLWLESVLVGGMNGERLAVLKTMYLDEGIGSGAIWGKMLTKIRQTPVCDCVKCSNYRREIAFGKRQPEKNRLAKEQCARPHVWPSAIRIAMHDEKVVFGCRYCTTSRDCLCPVKSSMLRCIRKRPRTKSELRSIFHYISASELQRCLSDLSSIGAITSGHRVWLGQTSRAGGAG